MAKKTQGYAKALEELEGILQAIEQDERLDIDELSNKVERAAELIKLLRERLKGTELRVSKVVESLQEEEASLETESFPEEKPRADASGEGERDDGSNDGGSDDDDDDDDDIPF